MSERKITLGGTAVRFNEPTNDSGRSVPIMFLRGSFPQDVLNDPEIALKLNHSGEPLATRGDGLEIWQDERGVHWYAHLPYGEHLLLGSGIDSGRHSACSIDFEGRGRETWIDGRKVFAVRRVEKILDVGPVRAAGNSRCKCLTIWPSQWKTTNQKESQPRPKVQPPERPKRRVRSSALRARMRGHQTAMGKSLPMQRGIIAHNMLENGIGLGVLCSIDGKKQIDAERLRRNVVRLG